MKASDQLLDAKTYESTRLGVMESETLPAGVYTSATLHQREIERIFSKDWYVVGDATRIPNSGDFFTIELCGKSIIIVRGEDGVVRAFINACRHRGMEIVDGEGNVDRFSCPYHSWVYSLDGTLLNPMEMQKTLHFEKQDFGLLPVRIESWGVFLFINLDHNAVSLSARLGDLPQRFDLYDFDDLVCARHKVWEVACNWKLLLENGMEELHVGTVHNKTIQQYAPASIFERVAPTGEYGILEGKTTRTIALLKGKPGFPRSAGAKGSHRIRPILCSSIQARSSYSPPTACGTDRDGPWVRIKPATSPLPTSRAAPWRALISTRSRRVITIGWKKLIWKISRQWNDNNAAYVRPATCVAASLIARSWSTTSPIGGSTGCSVQANRHHPLNRQEHFNNVREKQRRDP